MLLTPNAEIVNFTQLAAIPTPEWTDSYRPVPYRDCVETVRSVLANHLSHREVLSEDFALGRKGQHLFGLWTLDADADGNKLTIGMRQSYDKSFALGLVGGAQVVVCSNLMFCADDVHVVRKNTTNTYADFRERAVEAVLAADGAHKRLQEDMELMRSIPVPTVRGAEIMGHALYDGVLAPQQAIVAMQAWKDAPHAEFQPRNLWSVYNAFTEGLKKGPAGSIIDRHARAHDFILDVAGAVGEA
jgi:hypothetical protein